MWNVSSPAFVSSLKSVCSACSTRKVPSLCAALIRGIFDGLAWILFEYVCQENDVSLVFANSLSLLAPFSRCLPIVDFEQFVS